jgi:hypothetical protein
MGVAGCRPDFLAGIGFGKFVSTNINIMPLRMSSDKLPCCSQIIWENRHKDDVGNDCLVSVDGVDCRIPDVKKWDPVKKKMVMNKKLFSHKFKGAGLRFEVGICLLTSDIVWIHG